MVIQFVVTKNDYEKIYVYQYLKHIHVNKFWKIIFKIYIYTVIKKYEVYIRTTNINTNNYNLY